MHYNTKKIAKVETERFEFDFRLIDLMDIYSKKVNVSKNKIFETAIKEYCHSLRLTFNTKRKIKRKYLVKPSTLELIESYSARNGIPKNTLANKALKFYLIERYRYKKRSLFTRKDFRNV